MTTERESIAIELVDPDTIRIRYVRVERGRDHVDDLVVDGANAAWLAAELAATAADGHRPDAVLEGGSDVLKVFCGGHERDPYVNVTNNRKSAATWARMWALMLRAPSASRLAALLLDPARPHSLGEQIRDWAENVCRAPSTSAADLAAVLGPALDDPPPGVARFTFDERPVGLGGVVVDVDPGVLTRADIEERFGTGMQLRRLHPHDHRHRQYELTVPGAPHSCRLFVRYGVAPADERVRQVKLRVEAVRSAPGTDERRGGAGGVST